MSETTWKSLAIHCVMNEKRTRKCVKSQTRECKSIRHLKYQLPLFYTLTSIENRAKLAVLGKTLSKIVFIAWSTQIYIFICSFFYLLWNQPDTRKVYSSVLRWCVHAYASLTFPQKLLNTTLHLISQSKNK